MVQIMNKKQDTMYILSGLFFGAETAKKYRRTCDPVPQSVINEKAAALLQKVNADAITAECMQAVQDIINGSR
jgi:hypothetical protein